MVSVFVILVMGLPAVTKLSDEDSHLIGDPIFPDKLNTVLLVPAQTVVPPEILPPRDSGETAIVATELDADEQTPLVIIAL